MHWMLYNQGNPADVFLVHVETGAYFHGDPAGTTVSYVGINARGEDRALLPINLIALAGRLVPAHDLIDLR